MAKTKRQRLRQKKGPRSLSLGDASNVKTDVRLKRSTRFSQDTPVSYETNEAKDIDSGSEKEEPKQLIQSSFLQHSKLKAEKQMKKQVSSSGEWKVESATTKEGEETHVVMGQFRRTTRSLSVSESIDPEETATGCTNRKRKSEDLEVKTTKKPRRRGGKRSRKKQKSRSKPAEKEEDDGESLEEETEEIKNKLEKVDNEGDLEPEVFEDDIDMCQESEKDNRTGEINPDSNERTKETIDDKPKNLHASDSDDVTDAKSPESKPCGEKSPCADASTDLVDSPLQVEGINQGEPTENGHQEATNKCRVFVLPSKDEVIVILSEGEELTFQGRVSLKCLYGCVRVMGYNLTPDKDSVPLFSTESYCLLPIKATLRGTSEEKETFTSLPMYYNVVDDVLNALDRRSVIISLSKLNCPEMDFVCSVNPFQDIFKYPPAREIVSELPEGLRDTLEIDSPSREETSIFKEPTEYVSIVSKLVNHAAGARLGVAVCGGKNVGKSTFCRYLLNHLLNHHDSIAFLECDLGQTEFTPPGCVALHVVSSPLLGPACTHQRKAERMVYIGAVTAANDPGYYGHCLQYVFQTYKNLPGNPPLIINTMGWNKGLGLMFLAGTLRMTSPDYMIQLNSPNPTRNLPDITTQFVTTTQGWDMQPIPEEGFDYKPHELISLDCPDKSHLQNTGFRPSEFRDMALLSYLGQLGRDNPGPPNLLAHKPYHIPWNFVAVHVNHEAVSPSQIMYALNASVVGLCMVKEEEMVDPEDNDVPKVLKENPVCECIGFGVVRAVDAEAKELLVITPASPSDLLEVNCLIRGIVDLPAQLLLNQVTMDGEIPYISSAKDDVVGASSIKPRRHLIRKGDKSPNRGGT